MPCLEWSTTVDAEQILNEDPPARVGGDAVRGTEPVRDDAGQPLYGEVELGECSSKLLVRRGDAWHVLTPLGGSATLIRRGETIAGFSSCSEHLSEVFIGAQLFQADLPAIPKAIRFVDDDQISLTGSELEDPTVREVLFVRDGESWKTAAQ